MDNSVTVIRRKRKTIKIGINPDGSVYICAPLFLSDSEIEEFYNSRQRWIKVHSEKLKNQKEIIEKVIKMTDDEIIDLKNRAREYITERVEFYAKIMEVEYSGISIKVMKSRWGSCSSKKRLNFNCLLMLAPKESIDSVVVHELCHLKEMNHSKRFYELVYRYFPNYDIHHAWLNKNGTEILARVFDLI